MLVWKYACVCLCVCSQSEVRPFQGSWLYDKFSKGVFGKDGVAFREDPNYVNCFVMEILHWGACTTLRVQGVMLLNIKAAFDLCKSKYLQVQKTLKRSLFVFIIPFLKSHRILWKTELDGWSSLRFISSRKYILSDPVCHHLLNEGLVSNANSNSYSC